VWLGGETLSGRVFAGGALIMLAAALAALPVSPSIKATPT
jgi:hypothetical protein